MINNRDGISVFPWLINVSDVIDIYEFLDFTPSQSLFFKPTKDNAGEEISVKISKGQ